MWNYFILSVSGGGRPGPFMHLKHSLLGDCAGMNSNDFTVHRVALWSVFFTYCSSKPITLFELLNIYIVEMGISQSTIITTI